MNTSSSQSATFSTGSDSSSVYSDHDYQSNTDLVGTQTYRLSHSQPAIGGLRRENAQNIEEPFTASFSSGLLSPELDEDRDAHRNTSSNHTAAYRFETPQEADDLLHQSTAEAKPVQHDIRRDATLDESRTYMQRVLADHDAASAASNSDAYRLKTRTARTLLLDLSRLLVDTCAWLVLTPILLDMCAVPSCQRHHLL
ncbi:hypothetical protein G6011_00874 [Alternaria panax]|uniref:Uncharacterized protein n=1 Tax=Alternaria panax TaxID=48097 RepID=A0AAD4IJ33_9PLEO|nr:hypothetical protein G6011_00874 [Alternaria panax]